MPLDTVATYERHDPGRMRDLIAGLPRQAATAWQAAHDWELPDLPRPHRVIVLGVGGSAIGADVVSMLAQRLGTVPVEVVRDYTAPVHDENTLIVACSFSGTTEETIHGFAGAMESPGTRLAITSGGRLEELAVSGGSACFTYDFPGPPRAAFGYALFPLLAILQRLGVLPIEDRDVEDSIQALEGDARAFGVDAGQADNLAKQLAARLAGRMALVIGPDMLAVAARRWAGQIAEAAKQWATFAELPELNHNLVVGLGSPAAAADHMRVVFLESPLTHERNRLRVALTADAFETAGIAQERINVGGASALEAVLRACYIGDWVSLYLAMLNGTDPLPTPPIDRLKAKLREEHG